MIGKARCSPVRVLCSVLLVLVVAASVAVLLNNSDTTATRGIGRSVISSTSSELSLYHKEHHSLQSNTNLVNFNATVHHVTSVTAHYPGYQHHGKWKKKSKPRIIRNKTRTSSSSVDAPTRLSSLDIKGLKAFVFFIGYPRSGHSIIGSMLDAHPNAIIAHEFNLLSKLVAKPEHRILLNNKTILLNTLYQDSYKQSVSGWRSNNTKFNFKGYTLELTSAESWQGRFTSLRVIGDKSCGTTSRAYRDDPQGFKFIYNYMAELLNVPIKVIHAVRTPYDMIATRLLYRHGSNKKGDFNETHKLTGQSNVDSGLRSEARAVYEMIRDCNLTVFEIHHADLIHDPKGWMRKLCDFLGLECSQSYLEMCDENTFKSVSKSRYSVEWQDETRQSVDNVIKDFPFFQRYSYVSD